MIDIKQALVTLLKTAAPTYPVYYELFYKQGTVPAITYIEVENIDLLNGDTKEYSTLRYEIKIWSRDLAGMINYTDAIDTAMKAAGWSRYAGFELQREDTLFVKVLRYVATGYKR